MNRIAIFASGSGSNAENIIKHFSGHKDIKIDLVVSNKKDAFVLQRADKLNVDKLLISRDYFYNSTDISKVLKGRKINFLVLAGFLWLLPDYLIKSFPKAIINIHPALLPKYGGKGMFGMNVHKAVAENGENETGITIHYCNEFYDDGAVIFQKSCPVTPKDSPEEIADKVHALEYTHFPAVIEQTILKNG